MPKRVDHDAYREILAEKAAGIFSARGYDGLGMRKIAMELGISKSALYYYFPSKESLFLASAGYMGEYKNEDVPCVEQSLSDEDKVIKIWSVLVSAEKGFIQHLGFLIDCERNGSAKNKKETAAFSEAGKALKKVSDIAGSEKSEALCCFLKGIILQRYVDGYSTDLDDIRDSLLSFL